MREPVLYVRSLRKCECEYVIIRASTFTHIWFESNWPIGFGVRAIRLIHSFHYASNSKERKNKTKNICSTAVFSRRKVFLAKRKMLMHAREIQNMEMIAFYLYFCFLFYCTCIYMIHMGMSMSVWSSSTRRHYAVCCITHTNTCSDDFGFRAKTLIISQNISCTLNMVGTRA